MHPLSSVVFTYERLFRSTIFIFTIRANVSTDLIRMKIKMNFKNKFLFVIFCSVRLPWNQNSPLGYVMETIFCSAACQVFLIFTGTIHLMFIGSSLHNQAFCKMFQHLLSKLENFDEHQHDDKMLHKLLRFHYLIKG